MKLTLHCVTPTMLYQLSITHCFNKQRQQCVAGHAHSTIGYKTTVLYYGTYIIENYSHIFTKLKYTQESTDKNV